MTSRSIQDCFILGSGGSLLSLTAQEVGHINNSDFVLAFNKYLIFHDLVGAVPTHYLLGDTGYKASLMLRETVKVCRRDGLDDVQFILDKGYRQGTPECDARRAHLGRLKVLEEGYVAEENEALQAIGGRSRFIERYDWLTGGRWARSMEQKIFHFRGSLSGAINIANILNPGKTIKLLGVDLDRHEYFFQHRILSDTGKWGAFLDRLTPEHKEHETIVPYKGTAGIQDAFPYMLRKVRAFGGDMTCCNPESYLVKNGVLDYRPVID